MATFKYFTGLAVIFLFAACSIYGCGSSSSNTDPSIEAGNFEGTLTGLDEDGNMVDKISYNYFKIDREGNVSKCSKFSDINSEEYFYFQSQTGDINDTLRHFPDENDFSDLFKEYISLCGTGEELFEFLSAYEIAPDVLYETYSENPGRLNDIIDFWKYLHDNYLALAANDEYDPEDVLDFLSYHGINLSDFPDDPESYFVMLANSNISFDDFVNLFIDSGSVPPGSGGSSSDMALDELVSLSQKQRLQDIKTLVEGSGTGDIREEGFILSILADIAIDVAVDIITDLITGTPTRLENFKEQPIDCYARINGETIKNSRYYSGGKVVSTDPVAYQYTQGALWWYNELNFTITTLGTIQNIYDGDHNGIDDNDIAQWGVFGRQLTTKGTGVSANRVHDIELKFRILDKKKSSIAVSKSAIDEGLPSVDIALTQGSTPAKFVIVGEYVVKWKCRGFWGQAWQSDECRFVKKIYVDTMTGIRYNEDEE
jgi:hypothetical protein